LADVQHPSSLNEFQRYKQACFLLKTSRGRNKAWFQEALELDFQIHLRVDGTRVVSRLYERRQNLWLDAPPLDPDSFSNEEKTEAFATQIIQLARKTKANAIGLILHLADEFATTELKAEFDNPADLQELRATAERNPAALLEGAATSSSDTAWRVFPYPATGSEAIATTISLSRQHAAFFDRLRQAGEEQDFPIIAYALSAPLLALQAIPEAANPATGRPFLAILHYNHFTVLAFFNEHADLRLLRTQQHRGQRRAPNLRHAVATTLAALELAEPDVFVLPLTPEPDASLAAEMRAAFPNRRVETVDWAKSPYSNAKLPVHCPEPLIATAQPDPATKPLSTTFAMCAEDRWPFQNFLPIPPEIADTYPTRQEFQLLRTARFARFGMAAAALLVTGWVGFEAFQRMSRPEWSFTPAEAKTSQFRLAALNAESQKIEHWDNLLEDRSKAWATMELLCRLFPENGGMQIKGFSHTARPEPAAGKSKTGFVKEWKINGTARLEALEKLNLIGSRDGITKLFNEVARVTGNNAFRLDIGNRSVLANVRTQENRQPRNANADPNDPLFYPFAFDLTITQRFEATDPLALTTAKAP
jgi:hypothetical protein